MFNHTLITSLLKWSSHEVPFLSPSITPLQDPLVHAACVKLPTECDQDTTFVSSLVSTLIEEAPHPLSSVPHTMITPQPQQLISVNAPSSIDPIPPPLQAVHSHPSKPKPITPMQNSSVVGFGRGVATKPLRTVPLVSPRRPLIPVLPTKTDPSTSISPKILSHPRPKASNKNTSPKNLRHKKEASDPKAPEVEEQVEEQLNGTLGLKWMN